MEVSDSRRGEGDERINGRLRDSRRLFRVVLATIVLSRRAGVGVIGKDAMRGGAAGLERVTDDGDGRAGSAEVARALKRLSNN